MKRMIDFIKNIMFHAIIFETKENAIKKLQQLFPTSQISGTVDANGTGTFAVNSITIVVAAS